MALTATIPAVPAKPPCTAIATDTPQRLAKGSATTATIATIATPNDTLKIGLLELLAAVFSGVLAVLRHKHATRLVPVLDPFTQLTTSQPVSQLYCLDRCHTTPAAPLHWLQPRPAR